ncbi:MAG: hypothetical protein ACYSX0_12335, partial [Planctomycetota bacterium]
MVSSEEFQGLVQVEILDNGAHLDLEPVKSKYSYAAKTTVIPGLSAADCGTVDRRAQIRIIPLHALA